MASDSDYASFLDKANQDTGGASTQSTKKQTTKATNTTVPTSLKSLDATFTSESDEPFEPVALKWEGDKLPSAKELGELIGVEGVKKRKEGDFNARSEYDGVLEAVKGEVEGDVGFYWVDLGKSRAEWWVVGVGKKGALVGVKALEVQS